MTWLDQFNRFPPKFCRLYAHNRERPLSHEEIARRAGICRSYVVKLSRLNSWNRVPMETAFKFASACGVNLLCTWRVREFVRTKKLAYQARAHPNARRMYDRMLRELTDLNQAAAA